jgi:hypothetical protein
VVTEAARSPFQVREVSGTEMIDWLPNVSPAFMLTVTLVEVEGPLKIVSWRLVPMGYDWCGPICRLQPVSLWIICFRLYVLNLCGLIVWVVAMKTNQAHSRIIISAFMWCNYLLAVYKADAQ